MATKRMLVDATHPEETRIVVTNGNRLEEFDFESASRRQLRGNIYLAKVTRVEPSLQAAFVDYGGNRHGFLAFSEIHPDYYQIPVADREALMADVAAENQAVESEPVAEEANDDDEADADADSDADVGSDDSDGDDNDDTDDDQTVEQVGGGDTVEEMPERKRALAKRYKIQEVIKRRQVMLVQVVKEERGNKGAALTSYLSLAGRYSVLMPNTARGGGISRKITNSGDRKRLKEIAGGLEVPEGMGIILRTAGASRTKAEVVRDFDYLMRLWENVRNLTLDSAAPSLVYEEGSLIKRTIRDLYNKDIDEIFVAGDGAFQEAKDFMNMIMPTHAKNVKPYQGDQPIFSKYNVESQLDSMFSPQVTLPSGGYIVINPTEALVSIDVNSGRATKEHSIEETALQTNLEAADEVARQLRLRDLAGLIVIDFIDMMERRSNRNVERRMKDALRNERARIQVGRISHFGLLEMSRQRMRFGVLESSTHVCPTCQGAGIVRAVESLAIMVMRSIEDHVLRKPGNSINVRVPTEVALYILNSKREALGDIEAKSRLSITITADSKLTGNHFHIERGESRTSTTGETRAPIRAESAAMGDVDDSATDTVEEVGDNNEEQPTRGRRRRGGRNRNRNGRNSNNEAENPQPTSADAANDDSTSEETTDGEGAPVEAREGEEEPRKRRRRGRRGGRRNRRPSNDDGENNENAESDGETVEAPAAAEEVVAAPTVDEPAPVEPVVAEAVEATPEAEEKPAKKPRRPRRKKTDDAEATEAAAAEAAPAPAVEEAVAAEPEAEEKPKKAAKKPAKKPARRKKPIPDEGIVVTSSTAVAEEKPEAAPKKGGWWQKGFFG